MANGTAIGWRTGTVSDVRDIKLADGRRFIKFFVDVADAKGAMRASGLCRPTIVPGGDLYKWVRVCNVPLAEIDTSIRRELFIGKPVKVNVVQRGEFFNITDCKTIGG